MCYSRKNLFWYRIPHFMHSIMLLHSESNRLGNTKKRFIIRISQKDNFTDRTTIATYITSTHYNTSYSYTTSVLMFLFVYWYQTFWNNYLIFKFSIVKLIYFFFVGLAEPARGHRANTAVEKSYFKSTFLLASGAIIASILRW